jgi:uracil-DNA glycosylase family 4
MSDTQLRRALLQQLESLERAGLNELPRPARISVPAPPFVEAQQGRGASSRPVARQKEEALDEAPVARPAPAAAPRRASAPALFAVSAWEGAPKLPPEERAGALNLICGQVKGCQRCQELAGARTQTVFGVGNPSARLCFMGEAPGADEDAQGEPFVGRAGQLLNKIIEACTLRRSDVYILNTIKCRPPGNRNPLPSEVTNCREYLDRQLDVIQPEFICCLGSVAAQALLATDSSIGKLRKRFFDYRGCRVLCTYHPAYLLRNPAAKKDVWDDMQLLMAEMGIALPAKSGK